jgi:PAS domain S-box-containing protein
VEAGITVEAFADPLDALEWLEHNPVDLVITDYKMPGLDGAAFTRRLRAMPDGADIPVIVVTAYEDRNFRVRALDAGATDFLQSPVDHFELVTRARNLLALGRRRHEPAPAAAAPARFALRPEVTIAPAEALARSLLDTVPAMISAADRSGRCIFANAQFAAAIGTAPAQSLIGLGLVRLFGPERAARYRRDHQCVFESGVTPPPYQEEVQDPSGRWRRLLTMKAPMRDATGAVCAVVTTSIDLGAALALLVPPGAGDGAGAFGAAPDPAS